MNTNFENTASSLTSYLLGLWGILTPETVMFVLGALTLLVRLVYDTIRLVRYIRKPALVAKLEEME